MRIYPDIIIDRNLSNVRIIWCGMALTFDDLNDDPDELLLWFQQIDRASFVTEKAKLELLRERLRNIYRFRQDPLAFLAQTERLWHDSS